MRVNSASLKLLRSETEKFVPELKDQVETQLSTLDNFVTNFALGDRELALTELVKLFDQVHVDDLTEALKLFDGATELTQELVDKFADSVLDFEWDSFEGDTDTDWEDMIAELPLLRDAKLSSEQRKKMGSSTFCGPNRSFPVPDCEHVVAARRLSGKAKVTAATKSRILACVAKKAKAMDCEMSEDDMKGKKMDSSLPTRDQLTLIAPEQLKDLQATLASVLTEKGMTDSTEVETLRSDVTTLRASVTELTEKNTELTDAGEKLTDSLKYLRQELKMAYEDIIHAEDRLIQRDQERREDLLATARTLTVLRDKTVDVDLTDLSTKDLATVRNTVRELTDSLDIKLIVDKLDDGMARKPIGTVDAPEGKVVVPGEQKEQLTMSEYRRRKDLMRSKGKDAIAKFENWVATRATVVED